MRASGAALHGTSPIVLLNLLAYTRGASHFAGTTTTAAPFRKNYHMDPPANASAAIRYVGSRRTPCVETNSRRFAHAMDRRFSIHILEMCTVPYRCYQDDRACHQLQKSEEASHRTYKWRKFSASFTSGKKFPFSRSKSCRV